MTPILLEEGNVKSLEKPLCAEMDKAIDHLLKELASIRTGKAHVSMIENIKVECYGGSIMNLKEVASLTAPDVNLLTIQPWDPSVMNDIERALNNAQLGINPQVDDDMIRLELPKMSSERRDELAKQVGKKVEECKVAVRNIRKDAQNMIRDAEKKKNISEDFVKRLTKVLQDCTDKYTDKADDIGNKKSSELKAF
ncbi:MAG: ribosome recycling factor [Epsilonproteobacteria bacterium]|nr:ribosome recycling factor [Campylobacterota bacterium]|tara:strand:- start:173 stop:760 length:588 start_codon:yes stop_codon:yes gene_type:complete